MHYKVFREFLSEVELLEIESTLNSYKPLNEWGSSQSVSTEDPYGSTTDSRIAKYLIGNPKQFNANTKQRIHNAIQDVLPGEYRFDEHWSIQRYLDRDRGRFDWHHDVIDFFKPDSNRTAEELFIMNSRPNRKISISVALNDRVEYNGGQFILNTDGNGENGNQQAIDLDRGDMVVFTSETWHGVEPVTEGERSALIIWLIDNEEYIKWKQLCDIDTERE